MYIIHVIQEIFGFDYDRYEYITINNKVQAGNKCQVRHVDSIEYTWLAYYLSLFQGSWSMMNFRIIFIYLYDCIITVIFMYNHNYILIILFDILKINLKFLIF